MLSVGVPPENADTNDNNAVPAPPKEATLVANVGLIILLMVRNYGETPFMNVYNPVHETVPGKVFG